MKLPSKGAWLLQSASFYAGLTKSGFAGGAGILITPLLAMVFRPKESLALALPLLFLSDVVNFGLFWNQWDWRAVWPLLPGSLVGILLATRILVKLPEYWVKKTLGALALFFVPLQVAKMALWQNVHPDLGASLVWLFIGLAAGFLTGVFSTMAHLGGIITTVYFLLVLPVENLNVAMVGSATVIYFWINGIKLITYARTGIITGEILRQIPPLLPLLGAGLLLGKQVNRLFGSHVAWFVYIVLALVAIMAWKLLRSPRPAEEGKPAKVG